MKAILMKALFMWLLKIIEKYEIKIKKELT